MITAWPLTDPLYPALDAEGADMFAPRSFAPDVGPPIVRRAATSTVESFTLSANLRSRDDLATLLAWWRDDLQQGMQPFVWRHPRTRSPAKFRFTSSIKHVQTGKERVRASFDVLRLPGELWFASYIPAAGVTLPLWVADYAGGVYGVGDARGVVGDLAALSGTYLVWTKRSDGTQAFGSATYAGDIPSTAPTGVSWLVGFAL